ncbi:hypothetical protein I7I53_03893 [Histoplasma capsulatum var. duboisii H88]|uniref:Uncharacterized protein n=1 Tax=Ajellomyces capsulatus (strain H88) TaxID=544711 RepID=A0A8A1LQ21_AJEC8|nr:hypothetical protein I7I53_03893 [Histoplasma capsulatum var. duboisii H88]
MSATYKSWPLDLTDSVLCIVFILVKMITGDGDNTSRPFFFHHVSPVRSTLNWVGLPENLGRPPTVKKLVSKSLLLPRAADTIARTNCISFANVETVHSLEFIHLFLKYFLIRYCTCTILQRRAVVGGARWWIIKLL